MSPRQRLKLAEILLFSADGDAAGDSSDAWDEEIKARIQAIDDGHETGIDWDGVLTEVDNLFAR